jgi:ankyrin repeat protein
LIFAARLLTLSIERKKIRKNEPRKTRQAGTAHHREEAASVEGHETIVALLLEKGANVNTQGGPHRNALQAALAGGHEAITVLLLEKGARARTGLIRG